jgi:hypothetical protein
MGWPVELRGPIPANVLEKGDIESMFPKRARDLIKPACPAQPFPEVIESGLRKRQLVMLQSHGPNYRNGF